MLVFRVCGARQNYVFSLYRNPVRDDRIYECLLTAIPAVHAVEWRASFLFMGDLNDRKCSSSGMVRSGRQKCFLPILMESNPGTLVIWHSLAIANRLPVLLLLPLGHRRQSSPVWCGLLWWHCLIGYVSYFFEEDSWCLAPRLAVVFRQLLGLGSFPVCWEWKSHPNSKGFTFLLSGQLQSNFFNTYTAQNFWASGLAPLLTGFVCICLISSLLIPCARVWENTLQEFPMSYSHTEWYLLFSRRRNSLCFGRSFSYLSLIKIN